MGTQTVWASFSFIPILFILFYIGLAGLSIYCLILFIKLAHRGIKALDIYINEKSNKNS
jgi:hypothetical protein